ncbi:MAG TPA: hypothetical protein VHO50_13225 [Bacteroidales bacterium]|nr:hypothetical protein [Bacteroidales bacterium]
MDIEKQILIAKGAFKHLPGVSKRFRRTGGTIESRYCYSVWMRHLKYWSKHRNKVPVTVAELGPGDSLGTGFAALLSGARRLFALDVVKYWDNDRNLRIFNELVDLFRKRVPVPDNTEYPKVRPFLSDYSFPSSILTDDDLKESLSESRLEIIRKEIIDIDNPRNIYIKYKIPWHDPYVITANSIDFIYSQAVLECIDDLDNTYLSMCRWMKPGALMSHTIDLKSHGLTSEWNGHWKFNDFEWYLVKGGRRFLINRQPLSTHIEMHKRHGFEILTNESIKSFNKLDPDVLSKRFRGLSEEDRTTSGVYVLSRKCEKCK